MLIHISALAIAFHRESHATESTVADYPDPFAFEPADDPPIPTDPDISLPPPPTVDFIEAHDIEHAIKPHQPSTPIRSAGQTRLPTVGNVKAWALNAPRPDYPDEARSRHIIGSGVALISVDPNTGLATEVTMEQSIGNPILDNSTASGVGVSNRVHHLEFGSRLHFS